MTSNPVSISTAAMTYAFGQRAGYHLADTIALTNALLRESVVVGCEVQNRAEWCVDIPPRTEREKRLAAWEKSPRYTVEEVAFSLREVNLPILSIHANRDVGVCLCSGDEQEVEEGKKLIHESLFLAQEVGAPVCVFHLWDTWAESFVPEFLRDVLYQIASQYPGVKAAVENVPTHLAGFTPFDLVELFEWITLDLGWAAMYDELDRFEALKECIANVHLRGRLEGREWMLDLDASFDFYAGMEIVKDGWGYNGMLTMEPRGLRGCNWENFVAAMKTLVE